MKQIDTQTSEKRNKKYNDWARTRPASVFLAIPILLAVVMGINEMVVTRMWIKAGAYLLSISAISTALFFLLKLTLRDISKVYPEAILFCDRIKPTNRLLYSNDSIFSDERKASMRKKIKAKKGIDLQKMKVKTYNNKKYVKFVDEAVSWLRDVTRFDDILFEYNCFYGFWRNLTAALLMDSLFLFGLAAFNKWVFTLPLGSTYVWLAVAVLVLSVLSTIVTYKNGLVYARKVYDVFMNLGDEKENY